MIRILLNLILIEAAIGLAFWVAFETSGRFPPESNQGPRREPEHMLRIETLPHGLSKAGLPIPRFESLTGKSVLNKSARSHIYIWLCLFCTCKGILA